MDVEMRAAPAAPQDPPSGDSHDWEEFLGADGGAWIGGAYRRVPARQPLGFGNQRHLSAFPAAATTFGSASSAAADDDTDMDDDSGPAAPTENMTVATQQQQQQQQQPSGVQLKRKIGDTGLSGESPTLVSACVLCCISVPMPEPVSAVTTVRCAGFPSGVRQPLQPSQMHAMQQQQMQLAQQQMQIQMQMQIQQHEQQNLDWGKRPRIC
jgi:hypothetical protein